MKHTKISSGFILSEENNTLPDTNKMNPELSKTIDQIAGKLAAEGITTQTWSEKRCKDILSKVVMAKYCLKIFDIYHIIILNRVATLQK